jgi:hypothetical protein
VDIDNVFNQLSEDSIFGNADVVILASLMISAFMSFGGYHSFAETFRISEAIATDSTFAAKVTPRDSTLYSRMHLMTETYAPEAALEMEEYLKAYESSKKPPKETPQKIENEVSHALKHFHPKTH